MYDTTDFFQLRVKNDVLELRVVDKPADCSVKAQTIRVRRDGKFEHGSIEERPAAK